MGIRSESRSRRGCELLQGRVEKIDGVKGGRRVRVLRRGEIGVRVGHRVAGGIGVGVKAERVAAVDKREQAEQRSGQSLPYVMMPVGHSGRKVNQ